MFLNVLSVHEGIYFCFQGELNLVGTENLSSEVFRLYLMRSSNRSARGSREPRIKRQLRMFQLLHGLSRYAHQDPWRVNTKTKLTFFSMNLI